MAIFGNRHSTDTTTTTAAPRNVNNVEEVPQRRSNFFGSGRRRSLTPVRNGNTVNENGVASTSPHRGLMHRNHEDAAVVNNVEEVPQRRSNFFGRRRSTTPVRNGNMVNENGVANTSPHRGLLHRDHEDASIVAARERVFSAEAAEKDADRALLQARAAVREAREHVKRVEREAAEEARLAKMKQNQARSISKRARPLGRHDRF